MLARAKAKPKKGDAPGRAHRDAPTHDAPEIAVHPPKTGGISKLERRARAIRDGKGSVLDERYYQLHKGAVPVAKPAKQPAKHSGDYDYSHQDRTDPNDAWFRALDGTVWDEKSHRWVDKGVHLDTLLPPPKKGDPTKVPHETGKPDDSVLTKRFHQVVQGSDGGKAPQVVHHAPAPKPPKPVPIEHQPTWVHKHPKTVVPPVDTMHYRFSSTAWDETAVDRFEGRNEVVRPGRIDAPPDTTHANVERPPHVDVGSEAPPPQANVPKP